MRVPVRGRKGRKKHAGKKNESPTKGERKMNERQKPKRRATYGGGGTEDNKCQNNDLPVTGRTDR